MATLSEVKNFQKRERAKHKAGRSAPHIAELRAALDGCLHQIDQMRGMFPDEDAPPCLPPGIGYEELVTEAGLALGVDFVWEVTE